MKTVCVLVCVLFHHYNCLLLNIAEKECSHDEVHKSCSFYDEYTCWESEDLSQRVKTTPMKLNQCKAGCFCNKGLVRAYPGGRCILALSCRDQELMITLKKIPNTISGP